MLHLALVQNLLTAVGAAPRFARPNFPMPRLRLPGRRTDRARAVRRGRPPPLRLPRAAGRHGRRRRRGVRGDRAGRRAAPRRARRDRPPSPGVRHDRPAVPIDRGRPGVPRRAARPGAPVHRAAERPGDRGALPLAGARRRDRPRVRRRRPSTRSSSRARVPAASGAMPTSGASWASSTSTSSSSADPGFEPARPVVAANVRPQSTGVVVPLITDPGTTRCMDLLNVTYEVLLQLLSRYFAHTDESPEQLEVLADVSVGLMYSVIKPLGTVVTTLPVGPDLPGRHGGSGVRALLPGGLPAPAPGGGVGPDGGAPARRGGVRPPLRRAVHARPDGAPGQGGPVARAATPTSCRPLRPHEPEGGDLHGRQLDRRPAASAASRSPPGTALSRYV